MRKELNGRVDLMKLAGNDFVLQGEFRVEDESYNGWKLKPTFKPQGGDSFRVFDEFMPSDRFGKCFQLIAQTSDSANLVASGYLTDSNLRRDVAFGTRDKIPGGNEVFHSQSPVWMKLLDDNYEPIVQGEAEFVFVEVSPWHGEREAELQRVLVE